MAAAIISSLLGLVGSRMPSFGPAGLPRDHSRQRIDTPVRIFGYPALAMLMLMMAGVGAAYLAVQIVRHDRTPRTR